MPSGFQGGGLHVPGTPGLGLPGYDTWRMPNASRPCLCVATLGFIAGEGQNGHANVDVSSNASTLTFPNGYTQSYGGLRHENQPTETEANIGVVMPVVFFVPAGWSYRIRQEVIATFTAPTHSFGNSAVVFEYAL